MPEDQAARKSKSAGRKPARHRQEQAPRLKWSEYELDCTWHTHNFTLRNERMKLSSVPFDASSLSISRKPTKSQSEKSEFSQSPQFDNVRDISTLLHSSSIATVLLT